MDNTEIAAVFEHIADILEIKGENVFRIRAYRTAAQNISELSRQLSDIYDEDPDLIDEIPGIGKDLKQKIGEMVTTGALAYYSELMKEFSPEFLGLLNISGLGPKKLKKLRDELGIDNADDLEKACRQGKVRELEGMCSKNEEKILEAEEHYREKEGRMLLPEADRLADRVIEHLSSKGTVKKIEKAGSLRRGRETVGDIDILAVADDASKAMDLFTEFPDMGNVIAKGDTKSSISVKEGPQVDLRIVGKSSFGAALVYFTGSKQHNVKIRKIAKKKGYKVNEYGVFAVRGKAAGKMMAGKTEKEVYEKLGMDWIPPELREDTGEVEAAEAGRLPRHLVSLEHMRGDLHMHTDATDGHDTLEGMLAAAEELGYEYIAVTEHSKNVRVANGMDDRTLLRHVDRIRKAAGKAGKLKVLAGAEVDILEKGEMDLDDTTLRELDIVIAAVHSKFSLGKEEQTERLLRALDNRYVNILAHPSGRLITSRRPIQADFDAVFRKAAENGVFLEINTHGERIDLNDAACRRAKELGASFSINTDSHSAKQLRMMKYGITTARRAWLEKKDVVNTFKLSDLMKKLRK